MLCDIINQVSEKLWIAIGVLAVAILTSLVARLGKAPAKRVDLIFDRERWCRKELKRQANNYDKRLKECEEDRKKLWEKIASLEQQLAKRT